MNIKELFEIIQDNFDLDDLKGEFILHKNHIVWSFSLDEEEFEECFEDDDDEFNFNFETTSSEELLQDAYIKESEKIELLLDELEEFDNWSLSEPEIIKCVISFKILKK